MPTGALQFVFKCQMDITLCTFAERSCINRNNQAVSADGLGGNRWVSRVGLHF